VRRSGHIPWGEYRLGLVILVGVGLFLWASIRGGASFLERRAELATSFQNVAGLTEGSPVWFLGVEIGAVKKLEIRPGDSSSVHVRLSVKREILPALGENATARIAAINFFGEKYVDLVPGLPGGPRLREHQELRSVETPGFDQLVTRGQVTVGRLDTLLTDLQVVSGRLRDGQGSLGLMLTERGLHDDFRRLSRDVSQLSVGLDASQRRTSRALVSLATALDTLASRMNRGEGTLGLLARDARLYAAFSGVAESADSIFSLAAGEGSVGSALRDKRMYEEMSATLKSIHEILDDIRRDPKKYFKVSIF
jgi:phospholipid/cholesterol/gamma-HCH transport system substrate-binding protein